MKLKKPIIILGQPRSGTSLLSAILNFHSHVGTSSKLRNDFDNVHDFLTKLLNKEFHHQYTVEVENPSAWYEFIVKEKQIGWSYRVWKKKVTQHGKERHLAKIPQFSFQLDRLMKIFPDAKFLFVTRKRHEVVASFGILGSDEYAFANLGYPTAINRISALWEGMEGFLRHKSWEHKIPIIKYDSLIEHTTNVLENLLDYLELPQEDYIKEIKLVDCRDTWKERVPEEYHKLLLNRTGY